MRITSTKISARVRAVLTDTEAPAEVELISEDGQQLITEDGQQIIQE